MDFRRLVRTIAGVLAAGLTAARGQAQSLVWTVHQDSGSGTPKIQTLGPGLAAGADGSVFALGLGYNGTRLGMLTRYSAAGAVLHVELERVDWPLAVVSDRQGRPAVLTPSKILGYDAAGRERWRADTASDDLWVSAGAIAPAPDDGYVVAGLGWPTDGSQPRVALLRLDEAGRAVWRQYVAPAAADSISVDAMQVDRAGRAYVVGRSSTTSPATTAHFVAAFGPEGEQLWSRLVESSTLVAEQPLILAVDPAGGAFVSWPGGYLENFRVRRFDASGATLWETASQAALGLGVPYYAAATPDGGGVVAGNPSTGGPVMVIAHDAAGGGLWYADAGAGSLGGLAVDAGGRTVVVVYQGTVLRVIAYDAAGHVAWSRESASPWDTWVVATGVLAVPDGRVFVLADGGQRGISTQFTLAYGATGAVDFVSSPGSIPAADWARAARLDPSGNALLLTTHYDHGYRDLVTKYDGSGAPLWSREVFGETAPPVAAIDVGPNGETVAVASWDGYAPDARPQVARLDAAGNVLWRRGDMVADPFDTGGASSVRVDAQGAACVAGWVWDLETSETHLVLVKYSSDGQLLWRHYDPHPYVFIGAAVRMTVVPGNRLALTGTVWTKDGDYAIRVAVVDAATGSGVWSGFASDPGGAPVVRTVVADSAGAVMVGSEYPGRLFRFGPTGALEWVRSAPDRYQGQVNAIAVDASREITVAFAAPACHLQRLSPSGESLWDRVMTLDGYCAALAVRPAGGFFVSGAFLDPLDQTFHGTLAAYDAHGQSDWNRATGKTRGGPSALDFLDADGSGRVLAAGYDFYGATDYDALAIMVSDDPKPPPTRFFTVAPCRVADTRDPGRGGPSPVAAGSQVDVPVAGTCGLPATARAIAANLTAVSPESAGYFTAFPTGQMPPTASLLNHGAGTTRASQAVLGLGDDGQLSLRAFQPSGGVHLLIDVTGYFE